MLVESVSYVFRSKPSFQQLQGLGALGSFECNTDRTYVRFDIPEGADVNKIIHGVARLTLDVAHVKIRCDEQTERDAAHERRFPNPART